MSVIILIIIVQLVLLLVKINHVTRKCLSSGGAYQCIVSAILTDNPSHHPKVFQVMKKLFRAIFSYMSWRRSQQVQDDGSKMATIGIMTKFPRHEISSSHFFQPHLKWFWTYSSHTTFLCHSFNSLDVMKGRASSLVCKVPPSHPKRKPSEWAN